MEELVTVALDVMGGDHAPSEIIKGGVEAVNASKQVKVLMVGDETKIKEELDKYSCDGERIEIVPTTEVISNNEAPVNAIRNKTDSSIVRRGRCYGVGRLNRSSAGWRTIDRRTGKGCASTAIGSVDSDGQRIFIAD